MTSIKMPLLALRGLTVFPNMTINFDIGRDVSLGALNEAMSNDQKLFLVSQKDPNIEEPTLEELYTVGTIVHIKQMLKLAGDTVRVLVEGERRAKIVSEVSNSPFFEVVVEYEEDEEQKEESVEDEALIRGLITRFDEYGQLSSRISPEVLLSVSVIRDIGELSDVIAANTLYKQEDKQEILELFDPVDRAERILVLLDKEINIQKVEKKINNRVKKQIDKMQKEHYLHEQIRAIQSELGEDGDNEVDDFNKKIDELPFDEDILKRLKKR